MVSKEIIVYAETEKNIQTTYTEKLLILNDLENNSGIDHIHFIALAEDCNEPAFSNTNIPSLMIKNIGDYIRPIINGSGYSISVQFNKSMIAISNKKLIQIGAENQINMYGFQFNNYKKNSRTTREVSALDMSTLKEKIISGTYALKINNTYFQQMTYLRAQKKMVNIHFYNEDKNIKDIILLTKYVLHINRYYNDCLHYLFHSISGYSSKIPSFSSLPIKIPKKGILLFIDNIYPNNLNISENGSVDIVSFFDIINSGMQSIYFLVRLYGENNARVTAAITNEKKKQKIYKREQLQHETNRKLLHVYHRKATISNKLFGKNINNLTAMENEIVELTYKKNVEYEEFLRTCTCKHISLIKSIRNKNSPEWEELKNIVNTKINETNEMLTCSLCSIPILCPHIYDKMESKETEDMDFKDSILRKYAGKAPIHDTYYCKICGGILYKILMEVSENFEKKEVINDIMHNYIWKMVKSILVKRVIFTVNTSINRLVTSIVDIIHPYIEDINKNTRKNKNNTVEIINNIITIYIYIYTYALITRIVSHNKNEIHFNTKENVKKGAAETTSTNNKELQFLLGNALKMILQDTENIIKKTSNITTNMIKPLFINAYKDILKTFVIEIETDTTLSPEHIINCSEYNILYSLKKKYNRDLQYTDIKEILNINAEEIQNLENVLDRVNLPVEIWKLNTNINYPGYHNNKKFTKLNSDYTFLSYLHYLTYSKEKIFRTNILTSMQYAKHTEDYYALMNMENTLHRIQQNRTAPMKYKFEFERVDRESKIAKLCRYYCNTGKKHVFNINIFKKEESFLYINTNSLKTWLLDESKNKELSIYKYTDIKCSLCDVHLSNAYNGNSDDAIIVSILGNEEIVDFYSYYMDRCPVDKAHVYTNESCSKCGVTKNMIYKKDIAYYKKYMLKFKERTIDNKLPIMESFLLVEKDNDYKEWVFTKTAIVDVSTIFNTNVNIIGNIGLIEGLDYKNIENGIITPENKPIRVISLDTYITSFIIDYEMLRNSNAEHCPYIEHIPQKWDNVDFSKFPDLPFDYFKEKAIHEKNKLDHIKMSNFILNALLTYILYIFRYYEKGDEKKAARDFSLLSIKKVVNNEFKISNHGRYFKSLIEDDDLNAIDEEMEDAFDKEDFDPFDNMDMDTGIRNFKGEIRVD